MGPVYTVGHSTRSIDEFIALLRAHGVTRLVDVRRFPASRRHPHFARDALAQHLTEAGIAYVHELDLGGRRRPAADSPNTWWRNAQFRAYADHLGSEEVQAALERVIDGAREATTALMCAEGVHWRCHRQLLADALVARGFEVRHILGPRRAEPHHLAAGARVLGDGQLVYPGDDQLGLFGGDR